MWKLIVAGVAVVVISMYAYGESKDVAYPDTYRQWTHVKSMVLAPGHALADPFEGIHHIYANEAALAGLQSAAYDDGAVFVFDLLEYLEGDNASTEGKRKFIGVMEYDSRRYANTGGWGFEVFQGNSRSDRAVSDGGLSCFGCHAAAKDAGYVFTEYRP